MELLYYPLYIILCIIAAGLAFYVGFYAIALLCVVLFTVLAFIVGVCEAAWQGYKNEMRRKERMKK